MAAAGDSLSDAALTVLLNLAGDPHEHVRINAVRSLATYRMRGANAVVAATQDADANVRITAAQALGTVLDSTMAKWMPLWDRDTTLMYRSSLLASSRRNVKSSARRPVPVRKLSAAGSSASLIACS